MATLKADTKACEWQLLIDGSHWVQAKQEVSALESQHKGTKHRLHTAQAAVREQSQLLQEARASISQQAELDAIETLETNIQKAQEVLGTHAVGMQASAVVAVRCRMLAMLAGKCKDAANNPK